MPIPQDAQSQQICEIKKYFLSLIWYYMIATKALTIVTLMVLHDLESPFVLLRGFLFFKFLFVILSSMFYLVIILRESTSRLGPGGIYLCGLYFTIFTGLVYYKMIVSLWHSESLDDFYDNFVEMIFDLGSELCDAIPYTYGYTQSVYLFLFMLITPTPIFGIAAVWLSYIYYRILTKPAPKKQPAPVQTGKKKRKFKSC